MEIRRHLSTPNPRRRCQVRRNSWRTVYEPISFSLCVQGNFERGRRPRYFCSPPLIFGTLAPCPCLPEEGAPVNSTPGARPFLRFAAA